MIADQKPRSKASVLRRLLDGTSCVRTVGVHDGLTARLVERAGFEAVWLSSFELSASHAVPDAGVLTMTQYLNAAEVIDAAVRLPVIADCDTGFGGPLNVAHAVRSFERRGIAGICIEDKVFPKINSFAQSAQKLASIDEFTAKIAHGKQAQTSPDFVLLARTEAFIAGLDIDTALERACSYVAAGADAILVHSKSRHPDQVLKFGARWNLDVPLVAVPTTYGDIHEQQLVDGGFRMVIYANHGLRSAIHGVEIALKTLARAGCGQAIERQMVSIADVFDLQGMPAPCDIPQL